MLVIHDATCDSLAQCCAWKYKATAWNGVSCSGDAHACACFAPTAEQLRELVEAAERVRVLLSEEEADRRVTAGQLMSVLIAEQDEAVEFLDAALGPFRKEK